MHSLPSAIAKRYTVFKYRNKMVCKPFRFSKTFILAMKLFQSAIHMHKPTTVLNRKVYNIENPFMYAAGKRQSRTVP